MTIEPNITSVADALHDGAGPCDDTLYLGLGDCTLRLRSNSTELIAKLSDYFGHVAVPAAEPDLDVVAIEREPTDLGLEFVDWKREPGKTGRKDAYFDLPDGRLVRKVRTGMLFLQSESRCIAAGPCLRYDNQVINFINAQYMNWLQQRGWMICHAAGLVRNGRAFGIAGFSGGGKSTLMLHLLDHRSVSYLTNDRLFVRQEADGPVAVGIPKLPRVNPGTIVHNRTLHSLIPADERRELLQLPAEELWELEDKYDVHVDRLYGPGRIIPRAPLAGFLVLNWKRDAAGGLELHEVDLGSRRDLLGAIMKSPGPFYQYADGSFHQDDMPFDEQAYLDALRDVSVYEARGRIDFERLTDLCLDGPMS